MAAHLRSLDFPAESHIALLGKNSAHWILADLAIWMAGHVTVPLYPTLTGETVNQILTHSESKLLLVGKLDEWDKMKSGVPKGMPTISLPLAPPDTGSKWEQIVAETEPLADSPLREAEEMATIVYTSGTTGEPKGVMLSFGAMATAARHLSENVGIAQDTRLLSYLPLAHVYERMCVESTGIFQSTHLYFAESLDTFLADLQRARPTVFLSVPRLWLKFQAGVFAKMPKEKLDRLLSIPLLSLLVRRKVLKGLGLEHCRYAASAAAPVPPDVLAWYRKLGLDLVEGYGMSENAAYSHSSEPGKSRLGYVGTSNAGVETRISEEGEILVKSPCNMMGYYKQPEMTAAMFTQDGFLKTGDMGELDRDGFLKITGRVKELFKTSKGKYVAPAPIENQLAGHPYIELICVAGSGFAQPFALVMLSEQARTLSGSGDGREKIESELGALLSRVNETLDHQEALQFLALVRDEWAIANGLITPTLKIKRAAVEKKYSGNFAGWFDAKLPVVWEAA